MKKTNLFGFFSRKRNYLVLSLASLFNAAGMQIFTSNSITSHSKMDSTSTGGSFLGLLLVIGVGIGLFFIALQVLKRISIRDNPWVRHGLNFRVPNRNIVGDPNLYDKYDLQPMLSKLLEQGVFYLDPIDPLLVIRNDEEHREHLTPAEKKLMDSTFKEFADLHMDDFLINAAKANVELVGMYDPYIKIWRDSYPNDPSEFYNGNWSEETIRFFESYLPVKRTSITLLPNTAYRQETLWLHGDKKSGFGNKKIRNDGGSSFGGSRLQR